MSTQDPARFERLTELLAPHAVEVFLGDYWDQQPLLVRGGDQGRFSALLAPPDIDRLLALALTDEHIELVKDGVTTTLSTLLPEKTSLTGFYDRYEQGHAIVLRESHVRWRPLKLLASALARELGFSVTADITVAPPGCGALPHSRPGWGSFVLQLSGATTWSAAAPGAGAPAGAAADTPETRLSAGDLLYVPRVAGHAARAVDAPAVYVTVGIDVKTWADFLSTAVELASMGNPELRRALGFGAPLGPAPAHLPARFHELARATLDAMDLDATHRWLACAQKRDLPPLPDSHFTQMRFVDRIDGETLVERRPGAIGEMRLLDGEAELFFPGYYLIGPEKLFLAMEFVKEQSRFRAKDIPGWYTEREKVAIVQTLVRRGYLRIVDLPG